MYGYTLFERVQHGDGAVEIDFEVTGSGFVNRSDAIAAAVIRSIGIRDASGFHYTPLFRIVISPQN